MIAHKREFYSGLGLLAGFMGVLVVIFLPIFKGQNGLDYMDSLYNSISKGSAYYIDELQEKSQSYAGQEIVVTLAMTDEKQAKETALLFTSSGASVDLSPSQLKVKGDLGHILANCLEDAENMFHNSGGTISGKYGYPEKQVLYNWWTALKAMDGELKKQKKFSQAKIIATVTKKGVECSYNYYKIEPQRISDKVGIVVVSLVFYVIYTVWYGFAIMYMFQGWGLRLEH